MSRWRVTVYSEYHRYYKEAYGYPRGIKTTEKSGKQTSVTSGGKGRAGKHSVIKHTAHYSVEASNKTTAKATGVAKEKRSLGSGNEGSTRVRRVVRALDAVPA